MTIRLVDQNGRTAQEAVSDKLQQLLQRIRQSGKLMQDGLLWTTRNHFETIYPDSKHYSPDKVQPLDVSNGDTPEASIDIAVPGVTRAYHDMDIRPRFRRALTIPIHRSSYGKKASDFSNAFIVRKKDGRAWIAEKQGGQLVFLFKLVQHVFQKQDKRLMPSDETYGKNICSRLAAYLDRTMRIQ